MEDELIMIKKTEYYELIAQSEKLLALEGAGVDNWCGYDDAMQTLRLNEG